MAGGIHGGMVKGLDGKWMVKDIRKREKDGMVSEQGGERRTKERNVLRRLKGKREGK